MQSGSAARKVDGIFDPESLRTDPAAMSLHDLVSSFSNLSILVLGDVMLDRFIWGSVDRISPEAPVPVVQVEKENFYPGGAANVARNLAPFGNDIFACGLIGMDANGDTLQQALSDAGIICTRMVRDPEFETICKTRVIARHQQVVRIDREKLRVLTVEQVEGILENIRSMTNQIDAIILEDYAKGFLNAQLVEGVTRIACEAGLVITVDPNPRNPLPYHDVTAVKPNRREAFAMAGISDSPYPHPHPLDDKNLIEAGHRLRGIWDTPNVLVTLGEQGMLLFSHDEDPHHIPTRAKEVFDISGAGDTAIALFTLALAAGHDAVLAAEIANHASSSVVGKLGTAIVTPEDFR
jgi:D-beta-D-heptose 7-phosphate kinase/D-beta-D-heptose 1-phosphate adenosyltransferase